MEASTKMDIASSKDVGKRILLPSSFTGGPRYMYQQYQDSMAVVRVFGRPDYFVTFTCNPKWPEIVQELEKNQDSNDRPDLVVRVFNIKNKELIDDFTKRQIFGKVKAYVYVIEFQKRGLPHSHILLIMDNNDKPKNPDYYHKFLSLLVQNQDLIYQFP